jgi:murein DD-endopeptidase MepM/ murein hydrolase activator NlpD
MSDVQGRGVGLFSAGFALGALFVAILVSVAGAPRPAQNSALRASLLEIGLPIAGLRLADIRDAFEEGRASGRPHEATDIRAPRGIPVLAVDAGTIRKLFTSRAGGLTVYQFDLEQIYCYYYAHLDRYAEGLAEGMTVKRGDRIGYVGSTGNANPLAPHLHFGISRIGPGKHWWGGTPVNPYPFLIQALNKK